MKVVDTFGAEVTFGFKGTFGVGVSWKGRGKEV